jgi:hypothetical protein
MMGYSTSSTEWPRAVSVSDKAKTTIDTLFSLLDDTSETAGDKLAEDVFTHDGVMESSTGKVEGKEGTEITFPTIKVDKIKQSLIQATAIRRSRDNAWKVVRSRRHELLRVYAHDSAALDLLAIGQVTAGLPNNKTVTAEFTTRIILVDEGNSGPKIKSYLLWAVSEPLLLMS